MYNLYFYDTTLLYYLTYFFKGHHSYIYNIRSAKLEFSKSAQSLSISYNLISSNCLRLYPIIEDFLEYLKLRPGLSRCKINNKKENFIILK